MSTSSKYAEAHAHPQGPGDARPTAMQIVEDENLVGKLGDKVILITGASSGIGKRCSRLLALCSEADNGIRLICSGIETARALHATGAKLFLPVRNMSKGEEVKKDILSSSSGKGDIILLHMDLEDLDSVRACAQELLTQSKKLNILVNNAGKQRISDADTLDHAELAKQAGVMALPERKLTKQGHETQFATNHLAHFLLFELLKETLVNSATPDFPSRVINLSSSGHRGGPVYFDDLTMKDTYSPWGGYAQAKLSNIWMANYIDR
jgi:NAD(P)-dependent dehydrogenase (short-subunit alcohol dehydrogenase family)